MSAPPPPYTDAAYPPQDKGGYPPPPAQPYPTVQQQYPPPPTGYGPSPAQTYPPGGPAQPGYPPQQPVHNVVITQPQTVVVQVFRDLPVNTQCPHCRAQVVTAVSFETGTLTWVVCLVLFLFGLVFGCCLIPFCIDACKDAVHICPNCKQIIGRYNRM